MSLFFDYQLPDELIAQQPTSNRDDSRLLVVRRLTKTLEHRYFRDLPALLAPGDLLVLNNTKVIPARLIGTRVATGGKWESLFLHEHPDGTWELLAKTRGFPHEGELFAVASSDMALTLVGRTADRHWLMRPNLPGSANELLMQYGSIPLPPYIRHGLANEPDRERYQTVFAQQSGSVAAPTAGLHFTPQLLEQLREKGIGTAFVTLHVGLGTFASISVEDPMQHAIHKEWCEVPQATIDTIQATKARGGRVIAVGTTTVRSLETAGDSAYRGDSGLYIHPPYQFHNVDAMITNFHLPKTTLLLLVQALSGTALLQSAYEAAIANHYRFYSYGDAMLVC